GASGLIAFPRL
uniref:Periviscerokinin-2 n=5 Tax=Eumantodea TaxID=2901283 RepID=PVK2_GONGO|nr:RecName: Full=Periviscerokinin-2 [Gongylus gongylodes]P86662.1 RecName: Full=Periviscerokinin-2 [Miomantis paykullii]P86666.1 RecName: Full=Periviscerokinin-2 [Phyllocrania paradoxa]P86669.1 RecName: Full=Periviscerokinin-2 [Popa spurca]P86672.1 RecName: Full=Periviscerokinin-2; Short=Tarbi-PVK-2 [Tarachodes bispinosus]